MVYSMYSKWLILRKRDLENLQKIQYIVRIFQPISSNRSYGKIPIGFVGINCRIQGGSVNSNIITLRKRKREKKNLKCKRRPENC